MMLQALGINRRDLGRHPDGQKEPIPHLMAYAARLCQTADLARELDWPVGFGCHQTVSLKPADGPDHRHVAHRKTFGKVTHSAFIRSINQVRDRLDVVLGHLTRMIATGPLVRGLRGLGVGSALGH